MASISTKDLISTFGNKLDCPVCFYQYSADGDHSPQSLSGCGHKVDLACARVLFGPMVGDQCQKAGQADCRCPVCRTPVASYSKDVVLRSVLEVLNIQPASSAAVSVASSSSPATSASVAHSPVHHSHAFDMEFKEPLTSASSASAPSASHTPASAAMLDEFDGPMPGILEPARYVITNESLAKAIAATATQIKVHGRTATSEASALFGAEIFLLNLIKPGRYLSLTVPPEQVQWSKDFVKEFCTIEGENSAKFDEASNEIYFDEPKAVFIFAAKYLNFDGDLIQKLRDEMVLKIVSSFSETHSCYSVKADFLALYRQGVIRYYSDSGYRIFPINAL